MSGAVRTEYGTDAITAGDDYILYYDPARTVPSPRLIIALHGHNNTATQLVPLHNFIGRHLTALVRSGRYMVLGIAAKGGVSWSDPAAVQAVADAVTYGVTRGAASGKYGIVGYSMDGLLSWNVIKRDAAHVAGATLWAPCSDLDWAYNANGTYQSEIVAAFGSYAATAGYRVHDEPSTFHSLSVPVKVLHATDDSVVPYSQSTGFLAAVNNPLMTSRAPDFTGDHTGQFQNVPDAETVAFFDACTWS
jgi:dienelactone hydrolase